MLRRVNGWFNTNVLLLIVHNMLLLLYIVYVYTRPVNIGLWMISFLIRDDRTNEQISYRQTDRQTNRQTALSHLYRQHCSVNTVYVHICNFVWQSPLQDCSNQNGEKNDILVQGDAEKKSDIEYRVRQNKDRQVREKNTTYSYRVMQKMTRYVQG